MEDLNYLTLTVAGPAKESDVPFTTRWIYNRRYLHTQKAGRQEQHHDSRG